MERCSSRLSRAPLALLAVAAAAACDGTSSPISPELDPQLTIQDAVHNDGNEHFFWLPPMVSNPESFNGPFDGAQSPVVRICDLSDCAGTVIAEFTMDTGPGSETVRVEAADEHYIVNWHTDEFAVEPGPTYRISVVLGTTELGLADVQLGATGKDVKNITTDETIGLKDGRTLPIKFRIEEGARDRLLIFEPWDGPLIDSKYPWTTTNPPGTWFIQPDAGELHWQRTQAGSSGRTVMAILDVNEPYDPDMVLSFDMVPLGSSVRNGAGDRGLEWAAKVEVFVVCDAGYAEYLLFGYNDDGGPTYAELTGTYQGLPADITVIGHPASPLGVWQRDQTFRLGDYVTCSGTLTQLWIGGGGWDFEGRSDNLRLEITAP